MASRKSFLAAFALLAVLLVFAGVPLYGGETAVLSTAPAISAKEMKQGEKPPVKTWTNSGEMKLPYATARVRIITKYENAGFKLKHEIPMGKPNTRCLMLWEKGDVKTIVMLWRIDVQRTGFSTGEMRDDEK